MKHSSYWNIWDVSEDNRDIFDLFIEEFLCRSINKFCDVNERKDIKRGDIENVCRRIQTRLLADKINVLAEKLLEIIKEALIRRINSITLLHKDHVRSF